MKDGDGVWCVGFMRNAGRGTALAAELWGVLTGDCL